VARSAAQALRLVGRIPAGGNYKVLYSRIQRLGLDTSHWTGQGHLRGETHDWAKSIPLEEILVIESRYRGSNARLKSRLLRKGLLLAKCSSCGITEWQGQPLSLHLDHVNGVNDDHRLENLRLICPNCHSQTQTYCGRNKGRWRTKNHGTMHASQSHPSRDSER
jgi:hypothetical protein